MYWNGLYNNFLYGNLARLTSSKEIFDIDLIRFNDYTFSDILISNIPDTYDKNTIDLRTYERSKDWLWLSNWLIKDKTITVKGRIHWDNAREMEEKISRIKAYLLIWEWTLYLRREFWIIQTKASVSNLSIPRENWTVNVIAVSITFKILDPFFYSLQTNELWFFDINAPLTTTINYSNWTHKTKPSISISFKEAYQVNNIKFKIKDKEIKITDRIRAWDNILINAEKLNVAKNWVYWIDWLWEFCELDIWDNIAYLDIDWDFVVEIYIKYKDTYV